MKTLTTLLLCCLLVAGVVLAASIDGKWVSERKMERDGQSVTIKQIFALKSSGDKIKGSVSTVFGDQEFKGDIKDGKIDGDKFSFTVVMETPNGEMKSVFEGTVEGDTIKGTATRSGGPGGPGSRPFEAKRQ